MNFFKTSSFLKDKQEIYKSHVIPAGYYPQAFNSSPVQVYKFCLVFFSSAANEQ